MFAALEHLATHGVTKITFNTFLIAYGSQLAAMNFKPSEIDSYLVYAKTVFEMLRGESSRVAGQMAGRVLEKSVKEPIRMICPGEFVGSLWD
jgi:hypothetical protein